MSLRQRLLVAVAGSGLLIVAAVALGRQLIVDRAAESELRGTLEARVDAIGRSRCEDGLLPQPRGPREGGPPPRPGERRPRGDVFFFGRDFVPRIGGSPPFPDAARALVAGGRTFAVIPGRERGPGLIGVMATGWDSELCAYAMAALPAPPPLLPPIVLVLASLLFVAALSGALYAAAGSPVRRLRTLAAEVRASAESRYERDVRVEGVDEIAGLARAFREASAAVRSHLAAVERREKALRDFVVHTSHDVGLPLSVLEGSLAEMRERLSDGRSLEPLVRAATQETHYVASLLHNLGAVARLETEDDLRQVHPVDMGALVERVAVRHGTPAREAGVDLNHAIPAVAVSIPGDVTLLEQAVNNLVHNAIRYNRPGGHVAVVLDTSQTRFELKVTDDGPGVGPDEMTRLGEPRFRGGAARSRRPEGLGLGLSIARDVAARHHLTLVFRRSEAGGLEAVLSGSVPPPPSA